MNEFSAPLHRKKVNSCFQPPQGIVDLNASSPAKKSFARLVVGLQ
jgi:hypothetical protein